MLMLHFTQQKTGCFRIRRFVRETGLEPASSYEHMNLNHARLPIPPFPHGTESIIPLQGVFVKRKMKFLLNIVGLCLDFSIRSVL